MIYKSLFFINYILSFITCKNYLPRFESLPPPLVYYAENSEESSRLLTCKAWPPEAEIKLYSTKRLTNSDPNNPNESQYMTTAPLHPLASEYMKDSSVIVRSVAAARELSKMDLHCLAKTAFGAVISRPFRVVEAHIGPFPSRILNAGEAHKVVKYFMHSNVAYVDCDPPISYPPAVIEVKLNDTTIRLSHRYKYIKRPNSRRVTLLILAFEPRDQGYYRCIATNSVTRETKTDPLVQQLKIKSPVTNVVASVKMTISGKELHNNGHSSTVADVISVIEGMNVTLFCVMESAPPPSVSTFKVKGSTSNQHRYISDKEFGLLSITKVSVEDEDAYQCSETGVSDTAQLKVQKRLSISQGPQDIRITELGAPAQFTCLSNDVNITPQWYFNGRIRAQNVQSGSDSSLRIAAVKKEDLGVYQCVARSQDEWVTQVASLSIKSEDLVTDEEDGTSGSARELSSSVHNGGGVRRPRIKKNVVIPLVANDTHGLGASSSLGGNHPYPRSRNTEDLAPPDVYTIDDNLAVLLRWKAEDGANGVSRHYRVQYKSRRFDINEWSPIHTLDNEITQRYFYVTSRHLQAQHEYQFRISVVMITSVSQNSQWSRPVSFAHIYPVQPTIQRTPLYNDSYVHLQWKYSHSGEFPVTEYRVMIRRTVQEVNRMHYSKYWFYVVPGSDTSEAYLGPLASGHRYQVVVYGIKQSLPRAITLYSAETAVETPKRGSSAVTEWPSKNNGESNTRLMFVILGSLAGLMVLVIVVLVLMCYCRERKSTAAHRNNRYKDPAKLIHSSEQAKAVQSSFLLASINAAANANKPLCGSVEQNNNGCGGGGGEHASLLSTGPDQVYYQQKRQPPSGGSGHDMSDGEAASVQDHQSMMMMTMHSDNALLAASRNISAGMAQHGHNTLHHMPLSTGTMLTPSPPAVTYYKAGPGPASLPAGSLMRQSHQQQTPPPSAQQQFAPSQQRYSPGYQYGPQILYTNTGMVYTPGGYMGAMYPGQHQQSHQMIPGTQMRQDLCDMRSQDGGESVYSYFSQTSNNNFNNGNSVQRQYALQGTAETGSQTMNSTGSAGHRHHRRKRRKTNNSAGTAGINEGGDVCVIGGGGIQPKVGGGLRSMYPGAGGTGIMMAHGQHVHSGGGQREVMYDTPPSSNHHHDPRLINVPPGMVLMQPAGIVNGPDGQCWAPINNTLTRRGTPTLFVEPPRIRDYSEYGIPHNQMMMMAGGGGGQPPQQQLAHLSQQNLHLHNQNLSGGYRDAQA